MVISLPYIFQVLYVLYFTSPRYQVSVYRTIGPLVLFITKGTKKLLSIFTKEDQREEIVSKIKWEQRFSSATRHLI